jgi:Ca2+/H+ antiporter, TMEM165/GDT1 family
MKRGFGARKIIMIIFFGAACVALFSFIVMSLWNAILPAVIHVSAITFWQALGILVLSKILFSGFGGGRGWHHKRQEWRQRMNEKLQTMSPDEREKFKQQLKDRCRHWRGGPFNRETFTEQPPKPNEAAGAE